MQLDDVQDSRHHVSGGHFWVNDVIFYDSTGFNAVFGAANLRLSMLFFCLSTLFFCFSTLFSCLWVFGCFLAFFRTKNLFLYVILAENGLCTEKPMGAAGQPRKSTRRLREIGQPAGHACPRPHDLSSIGAPFTAGIPASLLKIS